jgi:hypothetical protein
MVKGENKMKKIWIIGVVVIVAALGVGVAFAQEPTPFEPGTGYGTGIMGGRGGYGMMSQTQLADGSYGVMHEYMIEAFANAFGIIPEDLESRLADGESMWQVAEAYGFSSEDFSALRLEVRDSARQQAVEAGLITPEQAEWMNQRMLRMDGAGIGDCDGTGPDIANRPRSGMLGFGNRGARAASQGE